MPADIVNLRSARKEKARAGRKAEAAANRAKFGRTRAEKDAAATEAEREASRLEGHRIDGARRGADEDGR